MRYASTAVPSAGRVSCGACSPKRSADTSVTNTGAPGTVASLRGQARWTEAPEQTQAAEHQSMRRNTCIRCNSNSVHGTL